MRHIIHQQFKTSSIYAALALLPLTILLELAPAHAGGVIVNGGTAVRVGEPYSSSTYRSYPSYPSGYQSGRQQIFLSPSNSVYSPSPYCSNTGGIDRSTLVNPVVIDSPIQNSTLINPVIVSPARTTSTPVRQTNPACLSFTNLRSACQ
jgi:hypothetical protein